MLGTLYVAPGFALIQNSTPLEMRSVAAAINLFITNIIGLGLGPFTVGFFSDYFSQTHGEDGLRWGVGDDNPDPALGCFSLLALWRHDKARAELACAGQCIF
jgi:hypothetical protein